MNQTKYTVFCEASDGALGWCGSGQVGAPDSLPELIQHICATGEFASLTGIAWAHGLIGIDDEATAKRVCAESIAAGRLIEKVYFGGGENDFSYVALGIHSPMIAAAPEEKLASVKVCEEDIWSDEFISSVIASRPRPFRFSGASVKFHSGLSYLGGTVAAEQTDKLSLDGLMADLLAKPVKREPLTVDIARYAIAHGGLSGKRADKPAEPQRPRLTWADTKPVDRFPGFSVTSGECDLHRPYEGLVHPLQKMAEGKEGFGSAALLKVR